jgi:hypothetical protein
VRVVLADHPAARQTLGLVHLMDSLPVTLARRGHFLRRERVARDIADSGFCAAKKLILSSERQSRIRDYGRRPLPTGFILHDAPFLLLRNPIQTPLAF